MKKRTYNDEVLMANNFNIKKLLLVLSTVFIVLTFIGAIFVLTSNGTANAGYAVIPLLLALVCAGGYLFLKNKGSTK